MADEKPKTHPATPVLVLFLVFAIFSILAGVLANFNEYVEKHFGLDTSDIKAIFSSNLPTLPFGEGISVGDEIVVSNPTSVFAEPGGSNPITSVSSGTFGKVIDGPVVINGVEWWGVEFEDGIVGWVRGDKLTQGSIIANEKTDVYGAPGDVSPIGSVTKGSHGRIVDGPVVINGEIWWKVRFNDGTLGWVKEDSLGSPSSISDLLIGFTNFISSLKTVSTYVSLVLLTLTIYAYIRLKQVGVEAKKKLEEHFEPSDDDYPKSEAWQKIVSAINSLNPNDWKQAIIDADIILDELLAKEGYRGDGLGERLKSIDKADLRSLDSAWEAHKVRNMVAHGGGDFVLTQREAKRAVGHFEVVFRELGYL